MCVLRAFGGEFDPTQFLSASTLEPYSIYRRGDKRFKSGESIHNESGLKVDVSDAEWSDRDAQFSDAISYIQANREELERLVHWPGVECVVLDFSFEAGETATFIRCPIELASEASKLNIALEFSVYPVEHDAD